MDNIMFEEQEELYNTNWDRYNEIWAEREDIEMEDVRDNNFEEEF